MNTGDHIKDAFEQGKAITGNTSKPIKETLQDLNSRISSEFDNAKNLSDAKQARKEAVAKRLSQLRIEAGERQKTVAEAIGINVITLSGYEVGKSEPNFEVLVRLADFYKVSLDYLLCRTETKIEYNAEEIHAKDNERKEIQEKLKSLEAALADIKQNLK